MFSLLTSQLMFADFLNLPVFYDGSFEIKCLLNISQY